MRVAIFHASLPEAGRKLGGVEMTVHRLANALVEHGGCDVTVFSCGTQAGGARYRHVRIAADLVAANKFLRIAYLPARLNFVDFADFDVLHLHGDDWFFLHRSLPTVRTFHGSARLEARFAQNWRRKLLQYTVYPLEQLSARLATLAVAVGTEARGIYGATDIADNGVDTAVFAPAPKDPVPLIFYIGTWQGRKRGAFAYRIFTERVLPRWPNARLYMACDSVPDHPQVVNGGFPDQQTLAAWMAKAWVFLYPSLYEGFGIPYVEAMASGTAIVTSPNSGADYVLEHGRYGLIQGDAEIGDALIALLEDPQRRQAMAQDGLQRVGRFTWAEVSRQHVGFYQRAIGLYSRNPARPAA